jgi:hypothetical protein
MIVIYNRPGIVITGIGCAVAIVAMQLEPAGLSGLPILAIGAAWFVGDLVYRFKWGFKRFFHREYGGQFYYIPMWLLGAGLCWIGSQLLITSINAHKPLPPAAQRRVPTSTTNV